MAQAGPSGKREREILTAIVETFIATGEPVGSRTLSRASKEGISPATIRLAAVASVAQWTVPPAWTTRSSS